MATTEQEKVHKEKVQRHYDLCSPYYHDLWGQHIHHGFWRTGKETKEQAQVQLIEELASHVQLAPGMKVLDVGCGIGGTSIYLAKRYKCKVTGISLSPVQIDMAKKFAQDEGVANDVTFLVMDGEQISFENQFDVVWISEALSHFPHPEKFYAGAARALKVGGKLALLDWMRAEHLTDAQVKEYIAPIEEGMILPGLPGFQFHFNQLFANGFRIQCAQDISKHTAKTWDICLDIIANPALWKLAISHGQEFVSFLKSFRAMRAGFRSRCFVYGLIVAEKAVTAEQLKKVAKAKL